MEDEIEMLPNNGPTDEQINQMNEVEAIMQPDFIKLQEAFNLVAKKYEEFILGYTLLKPENSRWQLRVDIEMGKLHFGKEGREFLRRVIGGTTGEVRK